MRKNRYLIVVVVEVFFHLECLNVCSGVRYLVYPLIAISRFIDFIVTAGTSECSKYIGCIVAAGYWWRKFRF